MKIWCEPDDDGPDHIWTQMTTAGWVSDMITDFEVLEGTAEDDG